MSHAAYALIALLVFDAGFVLAKHGQPREPYSIWAHMCSVAVTVSILIWGGFFAGGAR